MKIIYAFIAVFFLLSAAPTYGQQNQNRPGNRPQREVKWVNPEIREMEGLRHRILKSAALGCDVGYVVWTPAGYAQNPQKRYPTLYFLHGLGGTEASDAASFAGIVAKAITDGLLPPVICVFPNGGVAWYQGDVERMIIVELIPSIDRDYRSIAKAQSRAIAGFSMGGFGSVYLSVTYPELFCAAGSFGGRLRRDQILPAVEKAIPSWKNNNFCFFFVNGDNDRPEEFNDLVSILNSNGIANKVMVLPDTGHDLGKYYSESSAQLFNLIKARLKTE